MTAHTERRTDSTAALSAALRLDHADTLEAITQALPELPEGTAMLTRAESMKVAEMVDPARTLEVFKSLRGDQQ